MNKRGGGEDGDGDGDRSARHIEKFTLAMDLLHWARFGGPAPISEIGVVQWAIQLRAPPTAGLIQERWSVSRPTAYRWAARLADVHADWRALMAAQQAPRAPLAAPAPYRIPKWGSRR